MPRTRRSSQFAALRRRPVARDIEALIVEYKPEGLAPDAWLPYREFFIEVMFAVGVRDRQQFFNVAAPLGRLLMWSTTQLLPLDAERIFHRDVIDRYVETTEHGPGRSTTRGRLRAIGEALTVDGGYSARSPRIGRPRALAPYTRAEIALFESDAANQLDDPLKLAFRLVLAVVLGTGGASAEIGPLRGSDFTESHEGLLVYLGPARREIAVASCYENDLRRAAAAAGDEFVFPGAPNANKMNNLISRFVLGADTPKLQMERLRTTWKLRALECRRLSLVDVMSASGVTTVDAFRGLQQYVRRSETVEYRRGLRSIGEDS